MNDLYRALLLSAAILATMVLGDALVYSWPKWAPQTVWALLDVPVHLILALLVISPLFAHPAISLDNRPFGHSLLIVLGLALLTLLISRQPLGALLILAALLSHIVRDASHGGIPLWWPLPGGVWNIIQVMIPPAKSYGRPRSTSWSICKGCSWRCWSPLLVCRIGMVHVCCSDD